MKLVRLLVDGFRWWMVPALVLIVGGIVALVALSGLAMMPAVHYTAL